MGLFRAACVLAFFNHLLEWSDWLLLVCGRWFGKNKRLAGHSSAQFLVLTSCCSIFEENVCPLEFLIYRWRERLVQDRHICCFLDAWCAILFQIRQFGMHYVLSSCRNRSLRRRWFPLRHKRRLLLNPCVWCLPPWLRCPMRLHVVFVILSLQLPEPVLHLHVLFLHLLQQLLLLLHAPRVICACHAPFRFGLSFWFFVIFLWFVTHLS